MQRRPGYQQISSKDDDLTTSSAAGVPQRKPSLRSYRLSDIKLEDTDFDAQPVQIPYASVALAIFLMIFGMVSLVLAWLHVTQQILGKHQAEIGFTMLGLLTFLPGFHHTRIAYYAWKGVKGFSWDDIPAY